MLYQINTRVTLQEVAQGKPATLDALPDRLFDHLADLGFQWVWLLGVWQTGPMGRDVSRTRPEWQAGYREALPDLRPEDVTGSPFAVTAYACHADFGGDDALARTRERLSKRGLKLMLDFVPNHVALDHPWAEARPEWLVHGSEDELRDKPQNWTRRHGRVLAHGRDPYFDGWPDTLQLNYFHPGLQAAMRAELASVAKKADGARCDMAMLLLPDVFSNTWGEKAKPADGTAADATDFWPAAVSAAQRANPAFTLMAEVYWGREWDLQQQGFAYTYDKRLYDRLHHGDVAPVRDHLRATMDFQNHCARFLENHDEPRAAATFAPERHPAAAAVTYLTPGLKFFYDGQFEGRKARAHIHLGRRASEAVDERTRAFYPRLLAVLRREEVARGEWRMLACKRAWGDNPTSENYLAFLWKKGASRLLVAVNFGPTRGQCYAELPGDLGGRNWELVDLLSEAKFMRKGDSLAREGLYLDEPAWGVRAFELVGK